MNIGFESSQEQDFNDTIIEPNDQTIENSSDYQPNPCSCNIGAIKIFTKERNLVVRSS